MGDEGNTINLGHWPWCPESLGGLAEIRENLVECVWHVITHHHPNSIPTIKTMYSWLHSFRASFYVSTAPSDKLFQVIHSIQFPLFYVYLDHLPLILKKIFSEL